MLPLQRPMQSTIPPAWFWNFIPRLYLDTFAWALRHRLKPIHVITCSFYWSQRVLDSTGQLHRLIFGRT
ncbi:predicted protein [Plenodomus lingam JN3]|uniref:Predicted protein n=1 Tax=Leptosphaeria maculans (strain JN3 / isolate v23.1.3 / race Av1-4-5-6-7-8) TaxID=985895 RepID=E4ZXP6_LEPMJ|nr:predicted protein [Plenodomus lingam JN3]CBX96141.1 predicted protein [Plenodomus lingam JN3]